MRHTENYKCTKKFFFYSAIADRGDFRPPTPRATSPLGFLPQRPPAKRHPVTPASGQVSLEYLQDKTVIQRPLTFLRASDQSVPCHQSYLGIFLRDIDITEEMVKKVL